ncbi:ABC transporter ATP-binding protein [Streptomyces clavuligerus]|uniref:Putative ABC transporter ATPase and permease component n=4 Tax=Streptomyces clavuligerus TaxID=1901 RepID=D5SMC8_STRCL|nr:ABC transporter ATP-binding protein [Streptomyces clavuligerus]EFG05071.1 Putative ABC transporter ATPase and permease component [Streptomyces clavuligerus]MBY6306525.1 ABC transporter ATP-binding protein [Streptomyces clavuligerus]QCS10864.1 ABC transporter ATP-binding protein [Streptomyces clavuligerus]QPJ97094.1 ATP-binding cassette domain-containing protein [Streptomyces clavuligerus]WDN57568.1 ABC transporter ATP-binding protein/permease [Streptomyces clavuligerus]
MNPPASTSPPTPLPGTDDGTGPVTGTDAAPPPDAPGPARPLLPVAGPGRTRREILRRLARRRGRLTVTLLVLLAGTAASLTVPPLLGAVVDTVVDRSGHGRLAVLGAALVGASLVGAALTWQGGRMLIALIQDTLAGLREDVFDAAVRLPADTLESSGSSDVVSRVTGDVEAISEAASEVLPDITTAGLTIALTVTGLAVLDPRLALAGLVCLPLHWYATRRFLARSHQVYGDIRRLESARGQTVIEAVRGAETIRAYRTQRTHLTELAVRGERAIDRQYDGARLRNRFYGLLHTAEFVGLATVLAVGYALLGRGAITLGAATAAALYFHRLFGPIGVLLTSLDDIQRATVGLARLVGVIDAAPPRPASPAPAPNARRSPAVGVTGVWYRYSGSARPALHDVSLTIPGGATVALVGASGSGKSTLARLVAGVGRPDRGRITTEPGRQDALRYLVTQEVHLFNGTLADNLRLARPGATDAELVAVLREVGADWALEPGLGLDTVLGGPDGADLDDGSVQHLALARVLLADPPLLVLDEPTAESGPGSRVLTAALARVTRDRTSVIVAHRLEQARACDLIVLLKDGRVAEEGTHASLLASEGEYASLWRAYAGRTPDVTDDSGTGGYGTARAPGQRHRDVTGAPEPGTAARTGREN